MSQNISIDVQALRNAAAQIKDTGEQYRSEISKLYEKIIEMNNVWSGPEYDQFKATMESYKEELNKLAVLLEQSIPDDMNLAANNYDSMKSGIMDIANSLKF